MKSVTVRIFFFFFQWWGLGLRNARSDLCRPADRDRIFVWKQYGEQHDRRSAVCVAGFSSLV